MADEKPTAAVRPKQGVRRTSTHSGVTHVRTYQSGQYVVVGNHLAQHREMSLTAIGLGTHILSLPEGTPVDIRSLADRFPEGRERIASALRELEAQGYLERVRERTESGRLCTRTYVHHTPVRAVAHPVVRGRTAAARTRGPVACPSAEIQEPPREDDRDRERHRPPARPPAEPVSSDVRPDRPGTPARTAPPGGDRSPRDRRHYDKAVALLAGLRRADDRLTLSSRDVDALAPRVVDWLERGVTAAVLRRTLVTGLPEDLKHPAGVIAYRLRALLPPPLPAGPASPPVPAGTMSGARRPHPFQTCDGCERAFRAPEPGRCRDCRTGPSTTRGPVTTGDPVTAGAAHGGARGPGAAPFPGRAGRVRCRPRAA